MNLVDALAEAGYTLTRADGYDLSGAWVVVHGGTDVGLVRPAGFGARGRAAGWEARFGPERVADLNRYPTRVRAAVAVAGAHQAFGRPRA